MIGNKGNGIALVPQTRLIRRLDRELLLDPDIIPDNHAKQPALHSLKKDFSLPNLAGGNLNNFKFKSFLSWLFLFRLFI